MLNFVFFQVLSLVWKSGSRFDDVSERSKVASSMLTDRCFLWYFSTSEPSWESHTQDEEISQIVSRGTAVVFHHCHAVADTLRGKCAGHVGSGTTIGKLTAFLQLQELSSRKPTTTFVVWCFLLRSVTSSPRLQHYGLCCVEVRVADEIGQKHTNTHSNMKTKKW